MRPNRRNLALLAALAVLVVVDLALREPDRRPVRGEPIFSGFRPDLAASITIERDGEALSLDLVDSKWVVVERRNFPAFAATVTNLLARLSLLSTSDLVASERSSHELFGLGDEAAHLTIRDSNGASLVDAYVGRPRDEAVGAYVRIAGEEAVFRAASLSAIGARPAAWLNTRLLEIDLPAVRAIGGELADGRSFRLVKRDDGLWGAAGGKTLRPALVDPLLLSANTLYFEDIASVSLEDAGLVTPWASLRFGLEQGGERRIALGAPIASAAAAASGEGGSARSARAATRPEWPTPWVAVLPEQSAARLEAALAQIANALR